MNKIIEYKAIKMTTKANKLNNDSEGGSSCLNILLIIIKGFYFLVAFTLYIKTEVIGSHIKDS